ncbi:MAG: AAA family ATPase [Bacteroidales bacterium]|nr:AAA family ATPase [Bacteroidales bacterium]
MEMKNKIEKLLEAMSCGTYEREELIGLSLLAALSGESIFLLGLPGVGKSMVARRLKMAFKDSRSFEYLMSRFSIPDEIFGPVSISKLKDSDSYERVVDGYLPTADVVFLDEIWKAGPAIQNSLLTVLNEKIFHNGDKELHLPLKAVISASNELPADGEGLEAMWDRFLIRYVVKPISEKSNFISLITEKPDCCVIPDNLQITSDEYDEIRCGVQNVAIPWGVGEIIFSIRENLEKERMNQKTDSDIDTGLLEQPYVSDRRWKKAMGVLQTSAFLNGRTAVDMSDCLLLIHILWDNDNQISSVERLVAHVVVECFMRNNDNVMGAIDGQELTMPVGQPISPDGQNYVFVVGDEDILIAKEDYDNLSTKEISYAVLTDDNRMLISGQPTSLRVKKTVDGLSVNNFSYPLKRNSNLRSGSVKGFLDMVNGEVDQLEQCFREMVDSNIFLLPYSDCAFLKKAFVDYREKINRKGYR